MHLKTKIMAFGYKANIISNLLINNLVCLAANLFVCNIRLQIYIFENNEIKLFWLNWCLSVLQLEAACACSKLLKNVCYNFIVQ